MKLRGIYRITSPSGKVYIGQSSDMRNRFSHYRTRKCESQAPLWNSLKKYCPENHIFEIILELPQEVPQEIMDTYEIYYIPHYRECGIPMMNIRDGGIGGGTGQRMSEENKELLRQRMTGNKHSLGNKNVLGKIWSDEQRAQRSLDQKGKIRGPYRPRKFTSPYKRKVK